MKKLFDLRFVIGVFFFAVGALLILYYFIGSKDSINIWSGLLYFVFGIIMIVLSYASKVSEDS